MIYKDFQGEKLSMLGYGLMRLPILDGDSDKIDEKEAERLIDYAYAHGINYFDTAWGYHGGNSELITGKALSKYPRESFKLTTKFPGYDLLNFPKMEEIFDKQLEKLQVEYFDFYLFHNLCELNLKQYLDPVYHIHDSIMERKRDGRIKHVGLSNHGSPECLREFLDAYGDDIEFCQLQLNFMDWNFQKAKECVEILRERHIPIWVMEPLRGGNLLDMASAEECFRWLQSIDDVTVVLSGMTTFEQLEENIRIFEEDKPLSKEDFDVLVEKADSKIRDGSVPCTACRYCIDHCPRELDIPYLISMYNEYKLTKNDFVAPMAIAALEKGKKPWSCIGCQSCEAVCPQKLPIAEIFRNFTKALKKVGDEGIKD